jgi:L-threonylcarbamoyladenylate synthase
MMKTQTAQRSAALFPKIRQRLERGEVIILPTATTYALVANAYNDEAVAELARLKRWRLPQPKAILTRLDRADEVAILNDKARQMISHFPYPITMIVRAQPSVPESVTTGSKNLLVLCPDQFIYDLVGAIPFPMTCAPAGISSEFRATNFRGAMQMFEGDVPLIVDGGESEYARSGTLVDFTVEHPAVLRYGPVSSDDLRPFVPDIELPSHMRK